MCGRFTFTSDPVLLMQIFLGCKIPTNISPRYNITPTQDVAVIANTQNDGESNGDAKKVEFFHWGLIPSWAKDAKIGSRMINARSETLTEKPSFRSAYKRRRCLILADGYYEWQISLVKNSNNRSTSVSNRKIRLRSQDYGRNGRQIGWINRSDPALSLHVHPTPCWRKFTIGCL